MESERGPSDPLASAINRLAQAIDKLADNMASAPSSGGGNGVRGGNRGGRPQGRAERDTRGGGCTEKQAKAVWAVLKNAGYDDPVAEAGNIVGRDIRRTEELSFDEAKKIISDYGSDRGNREPF